MASATAIGMAPAVEPQWSEAKWYAVYTCVRHEKKVAHVLQERSLECYLPVYETIHQWKDRKMRLTLPLFPGYLFVHILLRDRFRVLTVPSVVHLVSMSGRPVPLPDREIEALRTYVESRSPEPYPYLAAGRRVRVKSGPLEGCEGIVVRRKNRLRIVLSFHLIMRSVALEVDADDLEPVGSSISTQSARF